MKDLRQTDFLLIYEIKNREFESLCLLKYELEKRGYRAEIADTIMSKDKRIPVDAEVVVMPSLYSTRTVMLIRPFVRHVNKVVNMQWEQVFFRDMDQKKTSWKYRTAGLAKKGCHIAWGEKNYQRLTLDNKISPEQVCLAGNIALDFIRPELGGYLASREELLGQYSIPAEQKVMLFISSFSFVNLSAARIKKEAELTGIPDFEQFVSIAEQTQKILLDWFDQYLPEHPDVTIIYRPHPAEVTTDQVLAVENKHANFEVIREQSVRQWIIACDIICNWNSTSLAEAFTARKKNYLLRPVGFPNHLDLSILRGNEKSVQTYAEFCEIFQSGNLELRTEDTYFNEYYSIDPKKPSYIRICDYLETVYRSKTIGIHLNSGDIALFRLYTIVQKVIFSIRLNFARLLRLLKLIPAITESDKINTTQYKQNLIPQNKRTPQDIDSVISRLRVVLEQKV